jgi:hypothetical protein
VVAEGATESEAYDAYQAEVAKAATAAFHDHKNRIGRPKIEGTMIYGGRTAKNRTRVQGWLRVTDVNRRLREALIAQGYSADANDPPAEFNAKFVTLH